MYYVVYLIHEKFIGMKYLSKEIYVMESANLFRGLLMKLKLDTYEEVDVIATSQDEKIFKDFKISCRF